MKKLKIKYNRGLSVPMCTTCYDGHDCGYYDEDKEQTIVDDSRSKCNMVYYYYNKVVMTIKYDKNGVKPGSVFKPNKLDNPYKMNSTEGILIKRIKKENGIKYYVLQGDAVTPDGPETIEIHNKEYLILGAGRNHQDEGN